MKIAFTSKGTGWDSMIDPRFGRSEFLLVYDEESDVLSDYDNRDIASVTHGAGPKAASMLFDAKAEILITGNGPGGNAASVLEKSGMQIYTGADGMTIREAYKAFKDSQLTKFNL
ncbi:MAG: NifB/NifX family molybdenum-iron cluster-binding protein [Bacteroidales bacterium]|nr:NifB/NifX family molybdenum-iron cluster-binding protein [Bacteroidales bacterium]